MKVKNIPVKFIHNFFFFFETYMPLTAKIIEDNKVWNSAGLDIL